jgi:hypothetical protein
MTMRTKDRELLRDETGRHLLSTFSRIAQAKDLFPRLRPNLSHARLRRAVARLRSGAMPSIDSRIPATVLADLLEGSIEQDLRIRGIIEIAEDLRELERRLRKR